MDKKENKNSQNAPLRPAKYIIAVASGKGGVGKSTTAINVALSLLKLNYKVVILDADIYGPSLPKLTGISNKPKSNGGKIIPHNAFGLQAMSIGYLVPEDAATIWRGPMVMSAVEQLLRDVDWQNLDILIIDMPPGTGDAQLTLSQRVKLAGAIIVSTPQDLSLIDARKGLNMFKKVNVPILGIIENMSYFQCTNCDTKHEIFGNGGAKAEAQKLGVPFLNEIPLDISLRISSDDGNPIVQKDPNSIISQNPRSFFFSAQTKLENADLKLNRELYFNPSEAIGLGTISGVGIGSTLSFSNPGTGISEIFIPTKALYFKEHGLNTGDILRAVLFRLTATSGVFVSSESFLSEKPMDFIRLNSLKL